MDGKPLEAGERVLLIDARGRRYLVTLKAGGEFHSHVGALPHDEMIGSPEGTLFRTKGNSKILVFRPTMGDFVLKMKRGAQVVYPKDIALIVLYADIFPGAKVLEAGTGSGSLTIALTRSVGEGGRVISYEARDDHQKTARANVEAWADVSGTKPTNLELRLGDVYEGVPEKDFDRLVLDLPEPWRAVGTTTASLAPGGVMCCYLPTVPQVSQTVETMRRGGFALIETFESLVRTWNVDGPSVRPDHRMVGHTGFLVIGRKLATPTEGAETGAE